METLLWACSQNRPPQYSVPLKERCDAFARELRAGSIGKVEILQIRPGTSFLVGVTPEVLEQRWDYKFTIHKMDQIRLDEATAALEAAVPQEATEGDLRWGIVFYSTAEEKRVGALYFDRWGRKGAVNSFPAAFGGDFFSRLKKALSPSFE